MDKQKIYMVEYKWVSSLNKNVISKRTALGVAVLSNGRISCRKYASLRHTAGEYERIRRHWRRMETEDGRIEKTLDDGSAIFLTEEKR